MKFAGPLFIAVALLLAVGVWAQDATDAAATSADKPYTTIVARNMFGLLPIPPQDTNPPAPPVEPPPKITPNGIMTIFGRDQALFKVANKPKPGQPAKEDSYVLSEGERQDGIEVVKINHESGSITFDNHGTIQELSLVPAKDTGSAPGGGGPGMGVPMGGIPRPGPMGAADRAAMIRERQAGRVGGIVGSPNNNNAGNPFMNNGGNPSQPNMGALFFNRQMANSPNKALRIK